MRCSKAASDDAPSIAVPATIGLVVLIAIVMGVIRLGLLSWTVTRRTTLACDIQWLAQRLAGARIRRERC